VRAASERAVCAAVECKHQAIGVVVMKKPQVQSPIRLVMLGEGWCTDRPGGLNRYFADLLRTLRDQDISTRGVVLGPADDAPDCVERGGRAGDPLPLRLWRFSQAACRAGRGGNIVDAHFALYALLPVVAGPLRKLPLVVHFQGPWAEESRVQRGTSAITVKLKRQLERSVYRRASAVITLSGAFRRVLVEQYHVSPWLIHVVPPGVDLGKFVPGERFVARANLELPQDASVVVAVRRLVPRMGIDVLLNAWADLGGTIGDSVLGIVGEGPERFMLEELVQRLGIQPSVRFFGRVDDATLVNLYQSADVAVVPSVALEGFGLIVLEALACGTPVLVSDSGGLPEVMVPLDPDMVVAAGNTPALRARLEIVLGGNAKCPNAEKCRRYAEGFSWEHAVRAHRTVYSDALGGGGKDRLRIVYLDHCAELSGGELALLRLLPALQDVDTHVVLGGDGPLVAKILQAGISVEVFAMAESARGLSRERVKVKLLPGSSALASLTYVVRLARRLRILRPDLVHTNSLKSALYGGVAARLAGIPVIWHLRDRIAEDYLPRSAVRLVRTAARVLPAAVIANSRATVDTLRKAPSFTAVIGSPVGREFMPAMKRETCTSGGSLRIGMVGRIAPWKGQHLFLDAFALAFGNGAVEAVIVGSAMFGEDDYESNLRERAIELRIGTRVDFRGFRHDMASEFGRLDVVVHASTIPEPFGLVVAEAMAMGCAIVAPNVGGPSEMIMDGVSGLLYPLGDIESLASALQRLGRDPELRHRLGVGARDRAKQFSPEITAQKVMAVYTSVVKVSGDRRQHRSFFRSAFRR
jgi:glycosyltransferase involved in cell wall biosynthesis